MTSKYSPIDGIGGGFNKPADGTLSTNNYTIKIKKNKKLCNPPLKDIKRCSFVIRDELLLLPSPSLKQNILIKPHNFFFKKKHTSYYSPFQWRM